MASITFPKAQSGGFTGLANIQYQSVRLLVNNRWFDTTGSNASGTADTFKHYCNGFGTIDVVGQGTVRPGGTCAKSQLGSVTPGDFVIRPQQVSLVRAWPLIDVTGSGSTEKEWAWGISTMTGNVRGKVISGGPNYDDQQTSLTIDIDGVGSFALTGDVRTTDTGMPFNRGGPFPFAFNFLTDGSWTLTPDSTYFTSTMSQAVTDPIKADITCDLDTGETITHSAILYSIGFSQDMEAGGPVYTTVRWRFDAATA